MKLCKFFACAVVFAAVLALVGLPASAQSLVSGEVDGIVTDQTGSAVTDARVALSSSETGFDATTTTNSSGEFRFALVKPGNYSLSVNATGFSKNNRS